MFGALAKAFGQLSDPKLRSVVKWGVLGALTVYLALVAAVWWASSATTLFGDAWAETAADFAGIVLALFLPLLFFPALATAVMGPLLERVADAVEERHYPHLNWPRPQKWTEVVLTTLRFLAVALIVNLLALPIYGVLLFTGLTVVLVYLVNGYFLGREYFELVAYRRMEPKAARVLFRNRLGYLWLAGALITFLFSVPLLNLAAPVVATAFMTHVFQSLQRQETFV